jgi:hypothetical protein
MEITLENRPFVRADRNVPMHLIKPGLRHRDLEGIHLPSFRFSWKLKKLCRVDFFVFESWQTAEDVMVSFLRKKAAGHMPENTVPVLESVLMSIFVWN